MEETIQESSTAVLEMISVPSSERFTKPEDGPSSEYERLCTKLGVYSVALEEYKLQDIIENECIRVYDYEKVKDYLQSQCDELNKKEQSKAKKVITHRQVTVFDRPVVTYSYRWLAVRQIDINLAPTSFGFFLGSPEIYTDTIPEVALMTMEKILDRMPEAKFCVSKISGFADPFMAVSVKGSEKLWVIERWDEPGFRS